jgi:hypothetical protein
MTMYPKRIECPNCHVNCKKVSEDEYYIRFECPTCEFTYTEEGDKNVKLTEMVLPLQGDEDICLQPSDTTQPM